MTFKALFLANLAMTALAAPLTSPFTSRSSSCKYPPAANPSNIGSTSCQLNASSGSPFYLQTSDCSSPHNGLFVTMALYDGSEGTTDQFLHLNESYGPVQFYLNGSQLFSNGKGTWDENMFRGMPVTQYFLDDDLSAAFFALNQPGPNGTDTEYLAPECKLAKTTAAATRRDQSGSNDPNADASQADVLQCARPGANCTQAMFTETQESFIQIGSGCSDVWKSYQPAPSPFTWKMVPVC